jgi:hypothetical protein
MATTIDDRIVALSRELRGLDETYKKQVLDAADAEAAYRYALADRIRHHRGEGRAQDEAIAYARADVTMLRRQRDVEAGLLRGLLEQLDGRRGERIALLALARRDDTTNNGGSPS